MRLPVTLRRLSLLPLFLLAVAGLVLSGCSSDDDASATSGAGQETSDATTGDTTDDATVEQPQFSDEEMATALDELAGEAHQFEDMCDLMMTSLEPVLMAAPQTEAQAQSMLEFYVVMYERMAALVEDETHGQALADIAVWFTDNLSQSGAVLESINSGEQLAGLQTPEAKAALDYIAGISTECVAQGSLGAASEISG